jgi:hypothetical protein
VDFGGSVKWLDYKGGFIALEMGGGLFTVNRTGVKDSMLILPS